MNINDLIKLIQAGNITVNVSVTATSPIVEETVEEVDTDFDLDDRVLVCHIRKDGERVHTVGTVIEVAGKDDVGYYTRVEGDNGKHYRAGLKYNEERLGTVIYELD
jgi:Trk K+ transport system NAD-binding subunit